MGNDSYFFQTERLILRVYTKEDADIIYPVISRREIAEMTIMIPHPYPKETVYWWIDYIQKNIEKEEGFEFGIFSKSDPKTYIGNIGLIGISKQNNNAELAYFINPDLWNMGYATEACKWIIDFGFDKLALERIYGRCMAKNIASKRVMEKSGLTYEGTAKHEVLKWNNYEDVCKYGIIRSEWENGKKDKSVV
jgi:ribosomal-protein-alanine N-acetyltransferase